MKVFGWIGCMTFVVLGFGGALVGEARAAAKGPYMVSAQGMALAPNAGGQEAYALKFASTEWEFGAFANTYLVVGGLPMMGATVDRRFLLCEDYCWWSFYVQTGGGLSSAGPLLQVTWGTAIPLLPIWLPFGTPKYIPHLRVDIATQMIGIQWRGVTWSYPLWAGLAVAF